MRVLWLLHVSLKNSGEATAEVAGVDCSTFSIPPQTIIATNFTLSWIEAIGADDYEIAVFDTSGFQISVFHSSTTSIAVNGGESFPNQGYVDVRAYRGGVYACYVRLNFLRAPDPNPAPGSAGFTATIESCGPTGSDYQAVVAWSGAEAVPVTISYTASTFITGSTSSSSTSGKVSIFTGFSFYSFSSITVSDGITTRNLGAC